MKQAAEQKRKPSLKWELIGIVLMCWILPVFIIVGVLGYYINSNINQQFIDTITSSAQNAVKIAGGRINAAVAASHNVNYYPVVKEAYAEYNETRDSGALYSKVTAFLSQQYKYDDKFLTTVLYFCDEPENLYYTYNDRDRYTGGYLAVRKYYEEVHPLVKVLSPSLGTGVRFINVRGSLYMLRNVLDSNNNFAPYAVVVMELDTDVIFDGMKNVIWGTDATIWLGEAKAAVTGKALSPDDLGISLARRGATFRERDGQSIVYGGEQLESCRLSYIVNIDSLPLVEELSGFNMLFLGLLTLIVPLLLLALWFFYRNISRPMDALVSATKNIEGGALGYQIDGGFDNREFQFLSEAFNSMSARLKYQFERIYSEELALRDARIMALQSQINPHFLNNTLEIINWEARLADNIKVSRMIEALSTMLDAAMDRKGSPVVRLSEEMMYVDAYLYIIGERLGRRLTVRKEIDPALLDCKVPRLILQPIIENAVEHGVQPQQRGVISIRIYREEESLILQIENDGTLTAEDERHIVRLLSPDYDAKDESSNSLGIHNVNQRLKILYGEASGLSIKPDNSGHVVAKIVIGFSQSEQ